MLSVFNDVAGKGFTTCCLPNRHTTISDIVGIKVISEIVKSFEIDKVYGGLSVSSELGLGQKDLPQFLIRCAPLMANCAANFDRDYRRKFW